MANNEHKSSDEITRLKKVIDHQSDNIQSLKNELSLIKSSRSYRIIATLKKFGFIVSIYNRIILPLWSRFSRKGATSYNDYLKKNTLTDEILSFQRQYDLSETYC